MGRLRKRDQIQPIIAPDEAVILREKAKLMTAGATEAEIDALLRLFDIRTVSHLMTNAHAGFTTRNLLFATSGGRIIGSIYFNNIGRIRLMHAANPAVEAHGVALQYTISDDDMDIVWDYYDNHGTNGIYQYAQQNTTLTPAAVGGRGVLIEFFGANGDGGFHPSRGAPVDLPVALKQVDINILCNLAERNNNNLLQRAMQAHPLLSRIPIGIDN